MGRICITYKYEPEKDRWFPGDRWLRPVARRILRGKPRPSGLDKVFINLKLGLDRLRIPYEVNVPYKRLRPDDLLGVLGRGRHCLDGYSRPQPLVAGIGLMTHPSEWPTFFEDYPVAAYLQHSEWAADVYRKFFRRPCDVWPVGIDTEHWRPATPAAAKPLDFLIYDKTRWERARMDAELVNPVIETLERAGLTHKLLRYGSYEPSDYSDALASCRAMIFLCSHESQGIACGEALASGVPVLAWDPGRCLDPERFAWGDPDIAATSVPFFDDRCGERFLDFAQFGARLPAFLEKVRTGAYAPRDYIMENLTAEKCSANFVEILRARLA